MGATLTNGQSIQVVNSASVEGVFAACFARELSTRLVGGAAEPLYTPATGAQPESIIHYREDYVASALHEVAHWCIAGETRRRQIDFGYWYAPDGRSPQQQKAFEKVEYKPQALEWFFSKACGVRFRLSADNLHGQTGNTDESPGFARSVVGQTQQWQSDGLPPRAQIFFLALCLEFGTDRKPADLDFRLAELA